MTKLASAVGGTERADLEAFVAGGDTSVPGIEMSDLNDGDILSRTRENVNPNGLFQYVYIPDDGSENIVSDWVDQEHKKKLTRQWVDGVKSAIISRANAVIEAAREASLEARARKIKEEQMSDDDAVENYKPTATIAAVSAVRQTTSPTVVVRNPRSADSSDPESYVEDQLTEAREQLKAAEEMLKDVTKEVMVYRKAVAKWNSLAAALNGTESVPDVDSSAELVLRSPLRSTRTPGSKPALITEL